VNINNVETIQITSQVLWRLLLPPLLEFLKDSDREIYDDIIAIKTDHVSIELAVEMLQTDSRIQSYLIAYALHEFHGNM
jgi:hypothetical protein